MNTGQRETQSGGSVPGVVGPELIIGPQKSHM